MMRKTTRAKDNRRFTQNTKTSRPAFRTLQFTQTTALPPISEDIIIPQILFSPIPSSAISKDEKQYQTSLRSSEINEDYDPDMMELLSSINEMEINNNNNYTQDLYARPSAPTPDQQPWEKVDSLRGKRKYGQNYPQHITTPRESQKTRELPIIAAKKARTTNDSDEKHITMNI